MEIFRMSDTSFAIQPKYANKLEPTPIAVAPAKTANKYPVFFNDNFGVEERIMGKASKGSFIFRSFRA